MGYRAFYFHSFYEFLFNFFGFFKTNFVTKMWEFYISKKCLINQKFCQNMINSKNSSMNIMFLHHICMSVDNPARPIQNFIDGVTKLRDRDEITGFDGTTAANISFAYRVLVQIGTVPTCACGTYTTLNSWVGQVYGYWYQ